MSPGASTTIKSCSIGIPKCIQMDFSPGEECSRSAWIRKLRKSGIPRDQDLAARESLRMLDLNRRKLENLTDDKAVKRSLTALFVLCRPWALRLGPSSVVLSGFAPEVIFSIASRKGFERLQNFRKYQRETRFRPRSAS